ncbi:CBS domain-containing protein [Paenibacillus segetis]|uniref:CBS domain-containing protein n=1 Tax=Paenibacillus segetis TaxID=1325360 RepID=A0ABQ1YNY9_9BACL|nr:CBS domain-containing protein [Paenibacillus segetis]GGH33179.1 hypothetical protein GCM10008013_38100 [Paenibacillus segetis]
MVTTLLAELPARSKPFYCHSNDSKSLIGEGIQSAPSISLSLTCRETIRVMFSYPESPCIVVCDKKNHPVGLIMCERFYLRICSRAGMDSFYNDPISKLMTHNFLSADINDSLTQIKAAAYNRPPGMRNDCIVVTDNGKFVGIVQTSDLNH